MKLLFLPISAFLLIRLSSAQGKQPLVPEFHFPRILGKTTAIERQEPPDTDEFKGSSLPPAMILQLKQQDAAMRDRKKALFADMEKDVNSAASRLLADHGSLDSDWLLLCTEFCSAITFRASDHKEFDIRKVATELKKFCQSALAVSAKDSNSDDPSQFELQEEIVHCQIELGNDRAAEVFAKQILADNDAATYGRDGRIIHDENMVLAEIAFRRHNVSESCERLLSAGKSKGSPSLDSFGPRFPLVLQLIKAGRSATVITYLREIGKFWNHAPVEEWIKTIQRGSLPDNGYYWTWGTDPYRPFHQ